MNNNSDWYHLSVWILNIFLIIGRFWGECYHQGSGSHAIASNLLEIVLTVALHLSTEKIKVSEKKTSKWIKDVHILHKRHWKLSTS